MFCTLYSKLRFSQNWYFLLFWRTLGECWDAKNIPTLIRRFPQIVTVCSPRFHPFEVFQQTSSKRPNFVKYALENWLYSRWQTHCSETIWRWLTPSVQWETLRHICSKLICITLGPLVPNLLFPSQVFVRLWAYYSFCSQDLKSKHQQAGNIKF